MTEIRMPCRYEVHNKRGRVVETVEGEAIARESKRTPGSYSFEIPAAHTIGGTVYEVYVQTPLVGWVKIVV